MVALRVAAATEEASARVATVATAVATAAALRAVARMEVAMVAVDENGGWQPANSQVDGHT